MANRLPMIFSEAEPMPQIFGCRALRTNVSQPPTRLLKSMMEAVAPLCSSRRIQYGVVFSDEKAGKSSGSMKDDSTCSLDEAIQYLIELEPLCSPWANISVSHSRKLMDLVGGKAVRETLDLESDWLQFASAVKGTGPRVFPLEVPEVGVALTIDLTYFEPDRQRRKAAIIEITRRLAAAFDAVGQVEYASFELAPGSEVECGRVWTSNMASNRVSWQQSIELHAWREAKTEDRRGKVPGVYWGQYFARSLASILLSDTTFLDRFESRIDSGRYLPPTVSETGSLTLCLSSWPLDVLGRGFGNADVSTAVWLRNELRKYDMLI